MRRILFPSVGVVLLLCAYAGQDLATGAPSAPKASAQAGVPVERLADEAEVLKHIAVAEIRLLESRAQSDLKRRRLVRGRAQRERGKRGLVKDLERREAWVALKADMIIRDAHNARIAQEGSPDQQLADLEAQIQALESKGPAITQEEQLELQRLRQQYSDLYASMSDLLLAQQDLLATMAQSI